MPDTLDTALAELRDSPLDHRLDYLSARVWRRIEARSQPVGGVWEWRTAAVALMLLSGAVVSGAAAARPAEVFSPFSIEADLAPSTLLADIR